MVRQTADELPLRLGMTLGGPWDLEVSLWVDDASLGWDVGRVEVMVSVIQAQPRVFTV